MRVEGEHEYLHAGKSGIGQKLSDLRRRIAEILGDQSQVMEPAEQHADQIYAGAGTPAAVLRGRIAVWHCPIALEAAEMVDADDIIQLLRAVDAAYPPAVAVGLHCVPIVQGVAPELPLVGEIIGRDAGHLDGDVILIELEEARLAPDIRRVERDIDRHIADELHALLVRVIAQRVPLAEEHALHEHLEVYLVGKLGAVLLDRLRLMLADVLLRPLGPADHAEVRLERHEQRVVLDPRVRTAELRKLGGVLLFAAPVGEAEHAETMLIYLAIINLCRITPPVDIRIFRFFQQLIPAEQVKVDKIRISGKG